MKIVLLFGLFPDCFYSNLISNSKGSIQYAADALQKAFVEGLLFNSKQYGYSLEILNLPFVGSYPQRYTKQHMPKFEFEIKSENGLIAYGENIGFNNFEGYRVLSRYIQTKRFLEKICKDSPEPVICIIYSIHSPFLLAATSIKRKYKSKLKLLQIVPDLPEYMNDSTKISALKSFALKTNRKIMERDYHYIDAFILLSKYMKDSLHISNQPWDVIEGIYNVKDEVLSTKNKQDSLKYIFYSGTLASRYNIGNLVEAFKLIKNDSYRLIICGSGDYENKLIESSIQDSRIIYKGLLPRENVLKLQRNADLLVNPRTTEGEFTKFSFPSKTMEYMASGVPTLLYKLPGIPDEYYDYCFTLEGNNVTELSSKITEILSLPDTTLKEIGFNARKYIIENKNPYKQCEKIMQLIAKLYQN